MRHVLSCPSPPNGILRPQKIVMAPPIEAFPASELAWRVHTLPNGKRRKGEDIDLSKCELLELVQYSCHPKKGYSLCQAVIQCQPVVKLFRK